MTRHCDVSIPDSPEPPFPITTSFVDVIAGFGRGSAELGIPTANVPIDDLPKIVEQLDTGVYFGWCKVRMAKDRDTKVEQRPDGREVQYNNGSSLNDEDLAVLPVVLSVGWNPFYQNKNKTVELHIIHKFSDNFYGAQIKFNFLGYIRPELDYTTKDALIADIHTDIEIAKEKLQLPGYRKLKDTL
ncbi:Fmn1 [Kluyveromyces lactis]|nr:Fmn1 [Kluyveromyces lactis]